MIKELLLYFHTHFDYNRQFDYFANSIEDEKSPVIHILVEDIIKNYQNGQ